MTSLAALPLSITIADLRQWSTAAAPRGPFAGSTDAAAVGDHSSIRQANTRDATHAILRQLLAAHAGPEAAAQVFVPGPFGKPHLVATGIEFSLSHSGEHALIAISRVGPVGIDIEAVTARRMTPPRRAYLQGIAIALSGPRAARLTGTADEQLIQAWVRIEAAAKATGDGVGRMLGIVDPADERPAGVRSCSDIAARSAAYLARAGLSIAEISVPQGYRAAIAYPADAVLPAVQTWPSRHGQPALLHAEQAALQPLRD